MGITDTTCIPDNSTHKMQSSTIRGVGGGAEGWNLTGMECLCQVGGERTGNGIPEGEGANGNRPRETFCNIRESTKMRDPLRKGQESGVQGTGSRKCRLRFSGLFSEGLIIRFLW